MKYVYFLIAVGVVLVILFALIGMPSKETIKLGYIGPQSGASAIVGLDAAKAIQLAVDEKNAIGGVNGKKIELFVEDDRYDTKQTLNAYNKLVYTNGVQVLIISTYGGVFAVAEQAKKDGVIVIDPLDCDNDIAALPSNTFCIAKNTKDLGYLIADYATEHNKTKSGVLYTTVDKFMSTVKDAYKERAEENGGDVQAESYTSTDSDFRTSLLKMKDKDVIVMLGYEEIGIAMRQARELGINSTFLTIPSVAGSPSVREASQGAIEGTIFSFYEPSKYNEKNVDFHTRFEKKYGNGPILPIISDQAYDTAEIIIQKVLPNKSIETRENELLGVKNFSGVTGTLTMKPDKTISGIILTMHKIENGEIVPV